MTVARALCPRLNGAVLIGGENGASGGLLLFAAAVGTQPATTMRAGWSRSQGYHGGEDVNTCGPTTENR